MFDPSLGRCLGRAGFFLAMSYWSWSFSLLRYSRVETFSTLNCTFRPAPVSSKFFPVRYIPSLKIFISSRRASRLMTHPSRWVLQEQWMTIAGRIPILVRRLLWWAPHCQWLWGKFILMQIKPLTWRVTHWWSSKYILFLIEMIVRPII